VNESLWTFVFEIANFVAFAALLGWLFFKPVRQALEDQRSRARRQEEEAEQKLEDAERLRKEVEAQQQAVADQLEEMRSEARRGAEQEADQIVAEAREQADRERAALKREALNISRAQTANIARAVATAANQTVRQFLEEMAGLELEQALVRAACRELRALSNDSLAPVTVESARPLDEQSQQTIRDALGTAADSAQYRVDPDLLGGLRISTARGLIDASIAGLADFAEHALSAEMESMIREEAERD
jgi:F0F1-type ATP synthase membrane subunit b/b'